MNPPGHNYNLEARGTVEPERAVEHSYILVATVDLEIRSALIPVFEELNLNPFWVPSLEAAKAALRTGRFAACLSGFWLQDGTYRQLVRHIRRDRLQIPLIIVSAPACPIEYRDYVAAANLGALGFLDHPYRCSDLQKLVRFSSRPSPVFTGNASAGPGAQEAA
jgi:DNA-binding NtrC family response regulator